MGKKQRKGTAELCYLCHRPALWRVHAPLAVKHGIKALSEPVHLCAGCCPEFANDEHSRRCIPKEVQKRIYAALVLSPPKDDYAYPHDRLRRTPHQEDLLSRSRQMRQLDRMLTQATKEKR